MKTNSQKPANVICALALTIMLAFGGFFLSTESTGAFSCWGRVASATYGNSSGFVGVTADTGCSSHATLQVTAMISRNYVNVKSVPNSGTGTYLSTYASGTYCEWVAVGYSHYSGGGADSGWTTDLWSC